MIYKKLIQRRILSLQRKNRSIKHVKIAATLGIEPSYLSRFLTDPKVHFSEELLFLLLSELEMSPTEIERILILKEYEKTSLPNRKKFLEMRLRTLKLPVLRHELALIKKELEETLDLYREQKCCDGKLPPLDLHRG